MHNHHTKILNIKNIHLFIITPNINTYQKNTQIKQLLKFSLINSGPQQLAHYSLIAQYMLYSYFYCTIQNKLSQTFKTKQHHFHSCTIKQIPIEVFFPSLKMHDTNIQITEQKFQKMYRIKLFTLKTSNLHNLILKGSRCYQNYHFTLYKQRTSDITSVSKTLLQVLKNSNLDIPKSKWQINFQK
eukprot:TRINITY_DN5830_c1_g2_i1.p2 TRINITY_DN5830_c1_g2~~TRINITY_DN5830_c1_g2_i1.p2  ORF type:complete len:185 (+),score=-16.83 TRINITY_DN5830_c1_g2_i1:138-692(+)